MTVSDVSRAVFVGIPCAFVFARVTLANLLVAAPSATIVEQTAVAPMGIPLPDRLFRYAPSNAGGPARQRELREARERLRPPNMLLFAAMALALFWSVVYSVAGRSGVSERKNLVEVLPRGPVAPKSRIRLP